MRNLKFPEIDKKIQQSVFGAWGGSNSNKPTYDGGWLNEVIIGGGSFGGSSGFDETPLWGGQLDPVSVGGDSSGGNSWGGTNDGNYWGNQSGYTGGGGSNDYTQEITNWSINDFFNHYNNGNGETVNLLAMGLRDEVIASDVYLQMMKNVNNQIEDLVHQQVALGSNYPGTFQFTWDFNNVYDFTYENGLFAIGSAIVGGQFSGNFTISEAGEINVNGSLDLNFHDRFEDPWDLVNMVNGSWDPTGTPYDINDNWQQQIQMQNIKP